MDNAVEIAASHESLSILALMTQASLLVQVVMVMLLLASLISWTMIFNKIYSFKSYTRAADKFEDQFWSGGDMSRLYSEWAGRSKEPTGISSIFIAGYREFSRLSGKSNIDRGDMIDGVHRAMRVALSREIDALETHLSFLATVGSTSPYIAAVRYGLGDHELVSFPRCHAAGHHFHRRTGDCGGADRHRHGIVCRNPGSDCL